MSSFKLSSTTLGVIKNFSLINPGMVFSPGHLLQSLEPTKAILSFATIEEEIPAEFAVSDLSRFIGALSLHDQETLVLEVVPDKYVEIASSNGAKRTTYRTTDKSNVVYATKKIKMPSVDAEYKLTAAQISGIISDASSLGLPHIVFSGNEVMITDVKDDSRDVHKIVLAEHPPGNFSAIFKIENFAKLLKNTDYTMKLAEKKLSHFESVDGKVEYFIALEK